jgi:hypothetical protein
LLPAACPVSSVTTCLHTLQVYKAIALNILLLLAGVAALMPAAACCCCLLLLACCLLPALLPAHKAQQGMRRGGVQNILFLSLSSPTSSNGNDDTNILSEGAETAKAAKN